MDIMGSKMNRNRQSGQVDPLSNEIDERIRELQPLRWFILLWVGAAYLWSNQWQPLTGFRDVSQSGELRAVILLLLMLAHAAGHWYSIPLIRSPRWLRIYLAVQGILVALMSALSGSPIIALLLMIPLAGVAVILLSRWLPSLVAIGYYVILLLLASVYSNRQTSHLLFLLYGLPLTCFVAGAAALFLRQANARRRAQALLSELGASHRQLSEYAAQVEVLTLAAERQRMARELHDTLAQGVAGLIMQLEAIDTHLERSAPDRARQITEQAMARARTILAEARQAIQSLRAADEEQSPPERIQQAVEQFRSTCKTACDLEITIAEWDIPNGLTEHALRIMQEGLANIARHAQARHAWVRWECQEDMLLLTLLDDGIGFDPTQEIGQKGHFGLLGLRERAALVGGSLQIESAHGRGTCLVARLPLSDPRREAEHA